MIALASILSGDFNRRGRRLRIIVAIGCITVVRAVGLGLVGLASKFPALIFLLYLNEFIIMAFCLKALLHGRLWSSRRGPPAAPSGLEPI